MGADAQRLREAAQFVRGVARAQTRANVRAAGLRALESALRRRVRRALGAVSYPNFAKNQKIGGEGVSLAGNLTPIQSSLPALGLGGQFAGFLAGLGAGGSAAAALTPICKREPRLNPFATNGVQAVSPQILDVLADLAGFGSVFGVGGDEGPIARGQRENLARRLAGALSARTAVNSGTNSGTNSDAGAKTGSEEVKDVKSAKNANSTSPTPTPALAFSEAVAQLQAAFRTVFPAFAASTVLQRLRTELEAQADRYARVQYGPQAFGAKSFSCPAADVRLQNAARGIHLEELPAVLGRAWERAEEAALEVSVFEAQLVDRLVEYWRRADSNLQL